MKTLLLKEVHEALGGKMVPFAGFEMPVQYKGVTAEHLNVRENVGVFDVSHMGEFLVEGPQALALIQYVCSNDASKLNIGDVQYSCLPNDTGGIVDDLLVYKVKPEQYLLVVNAGNIQKDWDWINLKNEKFKANLRNVSDNYCLFAVQGPKALATLQKLTSVNLSAIKYYNFQVGPLGSAEFVIISATGYTGAGGFEIYVTNDKAKQVWDEIMQAGAEFGIQAIGLAARDTLRLEMGYCLYGNDITDETSPIEAGLGWITKFNKDFVNKSNLLKQKEGGVERKLVGFELLDKGVPRHDYPVCNAQGEKIGIVTSGTMSPSLKKPIGLAYVPTNLSKQDAEIFIEVRDKLLKAKVVSLPFK